MDDDYGSDFITIESDDGEEFTLEVLIDGLEYNGKTYGAYLPADIPEDSEDFGMIILRTTEDEGGDLMFEDIEDDAELNDVYEKVMAILYDDEDEEAE